MKNLEFLTSVRFWKLVAVAIVQVMGSQGIISPDLAGAITLVLGGSVIVNTVDRFSK